MIYLRKGLLQCLVEVSFLRLGCVQETLKFLLLLGTLKHLLVISTTSLDPFSSITFVVIKLTAQYSIHSCIQSLYFLEATFTAS